MVLHKKEIFGIIRRKRRHRLWLRRRWRRRRRRWWRWWRWRHRWRIWTMVIKIVKTIVARHIRHAYRNRLSGSKGGSRACFLKSAFALNCLRNPLLFSRINIRVSHLT